MSSSEPSPRGPTWLLAVLAILPLAIKTGVVALGATGYLLQSSYKVAQLFAPCFWRRRYGGHRGLACLWPIDEPRPAGRVWLKAILAAGILAVSGIVTVLLAAPLLGLDPFEIRNQLVNRFHLTPAKALASVVYLFTLNAALEELHFRAWLDRELAARFGAVVGLVGNCALFATMHLFIFVGGVGAGPLALGALWLALFIAGAVWTHIARHPGGIHAAWLSHGLTDALLLVWGLLWIGFL